MDIDLIESRFKHVMIPTILMGVVTNVFLAFLFGFLGAYTLVLSPVISAVLFLIYFVVLKKDKISSKPLSLIVAYTVVVEIFIHSYYLGWGMGFYYYMFLLPIVFLFNSKWKTWMIIFFNSSIVVLSVLLWSLVSGKESVYPVPSEVESLVGLFNLSATAIIIYVVMVYFRRTINQRDEALISANMGLEIQNKKIVGQHEKLEVLLKEVHHRVKNNLQIISSLMSLARGNVESEEAVAILNESRRRVEAIALIHQKLYQDSDFSRVDIKSYLEEIIESQKIMNPQVSCAVVSVDIELSLDIAVPLGLIISEMITNSMKHGFREIENPELSAEIVKTTKGYELLVKDNGVGLADNFDINKTESLGLEIITILTKQIEGTIDCFNNESGGASFKLNFKDQ